MKRMFIMFVVMVTLLFVVPATQAGGLTDFSKSGFIFTQKVDGEIKGVDCTTLVLPHLFSRFDPVNRVFTLESLFDEKNLPPEFHSKDKLVQIQATIRELKRRGEKGEIALPAIMETRPGLAVYHLVTNEVRVVFRSGVEPGKFLEKVQKEFRVTAESGFFLNGKEGYRLTLTLESTINVFELSTYLAYITQVESCLPVEIIGGSERMDIPPPPRHHHHAPKEHNQA